MQNNHAAGFLPPAELWSVTVPAPNPDLDDARREQLRQADRLRRTAVAGAVACTIMPILAMAGWLFDFHILKSYWGDWATMKFNTALAMTLLAVGLVVQLSDPGRRARIAAAALHTVVLIIGFATTIQYVTGLDLGIDQLFVSGAEPNASFPLGRMAGATAALFSILALCCLLSLSRADGAQRAARMLNMFAIAVAFFVVFGYGSGPQPIYDFFLFRSMALPTSLSFSILGLAALTLRPTQMPASIVTDPGYAGNIVRGTLPWLVASPIIIAILADLGFLAGLYDDLVAHKLVVMVIIAASVLILLRSGVVLRALDQRRRAAAAELKRSHHELELRVERRTAELRDMNQELRLSKAEAEAARKNAEAASKAKSEFLSSMSHELRTPLNAVIGFGQLLEMDFEHTLAEKQKDYSRRIISAGNHLLNLVNEVLDLSGIEAGKLKLSIEAVSVKEVIEYIGSTLRPLAEKNGIDLGVAVPDEMGNVRADQLRLRQVLINLVSNAIKYNCSGGRVDLAAETLSDGKVRLSVSDTGIGIDVEDQKNLFEPFERLGAEYRGIEGTGIGLALSRKLVAAMGGTIGYTSALGKGSTFWVDLPAARAAEADTADADSAARNMGRAVAGGYSLLYIEDNPMNLRLMEDLTGTLPNVDMLATQTPQLGLDLALAHHPDVIVLDIDLPGMSGFEVLRRLKASPETNEIPVIALTASAFPSDRKRGLAAGFFRYLTKPLDVNAFLAAVRDALDTSPDPKVASGQ